MLIRTEGHKKKPGARLRQLLAEERLPLVGVFGGTAHHAQLAEAAGFPFFGVSGAHTSLHVLGMPDAGFLTLTELVENVRRVCAATNLPVLVDCDTGFGNAINVIRTVEDVIRAGAAGLFLEDQVAPKRCGYTKGKEVISIEEACGKYRAAIDVRDGMDPSFIIMARTDSRGAAGGSMDEVLRRCEAYLEAGVDMLYVEALQSREEVDQLRSAFPEAMLRATTSAITPAVTTEEMEDWRFCVHSLHLPLVGVTAMYDFLLDYRARGQQAWNDYDASVKQHRFGGFRVFNLSGFQDITKLEEQYLPAENQQRYETSIGVYDPRTGT